MLLGISLIGLGVTGFGYSIYQIVNLTSQLF